jgi:transcriptional regulator with XRE-family HTH domain
MNISAYKLAKDINMPATRISEILKVRRRMTADTALKLSKYFGNSADFWLGYSGPHCQDSNAAFFKGIDQAGTACFTSP